MSKDVTAEIGFSFEAVLEAVQDSSRGRWFLEEYKKRENQDGAARLMEAVGRIETRIEGLAGQFSAADDLSKVRSAIAKTRSDIASLQPESRGLSEEGRLFAHLADLARKAMPEQAKQTGIEQALRLVDHIDTSLNSNIMTFPSQTAKTGDRFFQQDAAVFEPKPAAPAAAKPAAVSIEKPALAKPAAEPVALGAKLTIKRAGQPAQAIDSSVDATVEPETNTASGADCVTDAPKPAQDLPMPDTPDASKHATGDVPKPRIVIIRRKPEDLADVPVASSAA